MDHERFEEVSIKPETKFDRQDIVNAIVRARGQKAAAQIVETGLDFDIADGLNDLGYRVVRPLPSPEI